MFTQTMSHVQFETLHGDSVVTDPGVTSRGDMTTKAFLSQDGARWFNSPDGHSWSDVPQKGSLEEARNILEYRQLKLAVVEKKFHEVKEQYLSQKEPVEHQLPQGVVTVYPHADDDWTNQVITELTDLKSEVEKWRQEVADQQTIVNKLDPNYVSPEELARREKKRQRREEVESARSFENEKKVINIKI